VTSVTSVSDPATARPAGWRSLFRGSAGIAVAMAVMNVATYGFQMAAARILGPTEYGAIAGLMALLMVIAVLQLGLQATAARRIAGQPVHVAQIEHVVMRVTYRAAAALGVLMLLLSPLVWRVLKLDSVVPALLLAVAAVPLTVMGGQAGILQGERRWLPLAVLYLGVGVPRIAIGSLCIVVEPTETSAMLGVMLGLWVPVLAGWWALRRRRLPGDLSDDHRARPVARETLVASMALLAFFVLSNADIVVARNVLDSHDAGLYAGGLILTKAVLFLPQFVVVVAFPSMSTVEERRHALVRSLQLVAVLGVICTAGAYLLSDVAMVFVGGAEYADVQSRLWLFAILGTLLAMLQLLVYSVLARQGTRSAYLVWIGVAVLVGLTLMVTTLDALVATVTAVDAGLFVVLLGVTFWRLREPART
jgi:O-antigen/teichoic acid export membrane protein